MNHPSSSRLQTRNPFPASPPDSRLLAPGALGQRGRAASCLSFLFVPFVILLSITSPLPAAKPTLARLSFWVPPERMAEFEIAYETTLAPLLKPHGLVASSERSRATADSVFSRLFELRASVEILIKEAALRRDAGWQATLRDLGAQFGTTESNGLIGHRLGVYRARAGSGKTIPLGKKLGYWRTYSVTDGLPSGHTRAGLLDRDGGLWFGTRGGVVRYDGQSWTTFTEKDGLTDNGVSAICQDREGNLWFATGALFGAGGRGVSRYNGRNWTTFTAEDGLAHNNVRCILQDRDGVLWFGTQGGASRYNGHAFTTLTTKDGLPDNDVRAVSQDRDGHLWFATKNGAGRYNGHAFTTLTAKDGLPDNDVWTVFQDRNGHLWFATRNGVGRYDGKSYAIFTTEDGLSHNYVRTVFQDRNGHLWFGTDADGVNRYDGQSFTRFTTAEGLTHNGVRAVFQDREGYIWVCTSGGGVSRYESSFTTFTTKDGLANNSVRSMFEDRDGVLWIGGYSGVSRYDGRAFTTFTTVDGLANNRVRAIFQDRDGALWFGTHGGACRYDGRTFTTFVLEDGLAAPWVWSICQDRDGALWFGTYGGGVSRYDGQRFTTFTTKDGLGHNTVQSIYQDHAGNMWFCTYAGLSRYDGQNFTAFTTTDGLPYNRVQSLFEDREDNLWFCTYAGVSRYDGQSFTTLTTRDGLGHNEVYCGLQDQQGDLWFGLWQGGVSRYNGRVFQTLARQDGLVDDGVRVVLQGRNGDLWFGTNGGLTRYRQPQPSPPQVVIDAVVAHGRYTDIASGLAMPSSVRLVAVEFHGMNLKTRPEGMVYRYRMKGYEAEWKTTRTRRVEYENLPMGAYTFQVQAVDRDLVYSESPAEVRLNIHFPYVTIALSVGLVAALLGAVTASLSAIRRRRERDSAREARVRDLEQQLQTAHNMQMGLMPLQPPEVQGLDIAGRCIPATHVGGDFFQYFEQGNKLAVAVADVTGHAMEAAIPAVMFSGILDSQMELGGTVEDLINRLNRSLYRNLDRHTFVCFEFGEIDLSTFSFRMTNGGCPYPYHFWAAGPDVIELQVDAYPLGVRPGTEYAVVETRLRPGDRVVFCSDGIIEAENEYREQFGFEETAETIREACTRNLSAQETVDHVIQVVNAYRGNAPQSDDMTCVVIRVKEKSA